MVEFDTLENRLRLTCVIRFEVRENPNPLHSLMHRSMYIKFHDLVWLTVGSDHFECPIGTRTPSWRIVERLVEGRLCWKGARFEYYPLEPRTVCEFVPVFVTFTLCVIQINLFS